MIKKFHQYITESVQNNKFTELYGKLKTDYNKIYNELNRDYPKPERDDWYNRDYNFDARRAPSDKVEELESIKDGLNIMKNFVKNLRKLGINPVQWKDSDIEIFDKDKGDKIMKLSRRPYNIKNRYSFIAIKNIDGKPIPIGAWSEAREMEGRGGWRGRRSYRVDSRKDALNLGDIFWAVDNTKYSDADSLKKIEDDRKTRKSGADYDIGFPTRNRNNYGHNYGFQKDKYNRVADQNRGRYAEILASKKSFDDYYSRFQKLFSLINDEKIGEIGKHADDINYEHDSASFPSDIFDPIDEYSYTNYSYRGKYESVTQLFGIYIGAYRELKEKEDMERNLHFLVNLDEVLDDMLNFLMSGETDEDDVLWL